jgi:hypothetical protein
VSQGEAVGLECVLERRAVDATLDARGAGHRVDLEHSIQVLQVQRDHPIEAITGRGLDAAADRGAATVDKRSG